MSGFNEYHDKVQSPAKVYHKWSGGVREKVTLPDGGEAMKLKGELNHWDATLNEKVVSQLPFKFAPLEQTRRISGFAPGPNGTNTRFYSNEAVEFDDEIKVYRKDGDAPAVIVCEGKYSDIKPALPQGARLASVVYGYNPDTQQIEVLTLQGASLSAFIQFSKANRIYTGYITIEEDEKKTNGTVEFVPPLFKMAESYTEADMDMLREKANEIKKYLDDVKSKNTRKERPEELAAALGVEVETPANESGLAEGLEEDTIDFTSVPF